MSKKKKRTTPRFDTKAPDNQPFYKKMISHYANHPALFFGILFAAFILTLAMTQK